jgi:hypothetical protein
MAGDDPTFALIHDAVLTSVDELYDRDEAILETTERVVVGRLMIYLNARLAHLTNQGYVLDQEYERFGLVKKEFYGKGELDNSLPATRTMRWHSRNLCGLRVLPARQHVSVQVWPVAAGAAGEGGVLVVAERRGSATARHTTTNARWSVTFPPGRRGQLSLCGQAVDQIM